MNRSVATSRCAFLLLALLCFASSAIAEYAIDWWTVDAGGDMWNTGGDFELSGTIGQPDAGVTVMTGGEFELTGGFWAGVPAYQLGDLNCDDLVNAFDIDAFVLALTDEDAYYAAHPDCDRMLADCNGDGVVNAFDIDPFVVLLVGG